MSIGVQEVNPYIRVARPSILLKGSDLKRRVIFDYELLYIESGEFTISYAEKDYHITEGDFLFFRPGVPHCFYKLPMNISQPHIHFDISYSPHSTVTPVCYKDICDFSSQEHKLLQKDAFAEYPQNPFVNFSDKDKVLEIFYSIINDTRESDLTKKNKLAQIIDILISDKFPRAISTDEQSYNIACQVKDYFDSSQGLFSNLDDLERYFSYSKFHLEREFKSKYGISIITYRNYKRMELAEKLLQTNSVSATSDILGFSSIYAFSRAFKQHFGSPPSSIKEYQQKIKTIYSMPPYDQ